MDEQELQDGLKLMLDDALAMVLGDLDPDDGIEMPEAFECLNRVATYDEVGILTTDKGLVIRTADGSEFQITIVRSK
jgi:hypothetical protein